MTEVSSPPEYARMTLSRAMCVLSGGCVIPSTKPRLIIPQAIRAAMLAQAGAEAPNECCGILAGPMPPAGDEYRVVERYPLVNALANPTEFESEARGLLAAHRHMRANGWEILAVYHSHPASP